MLDHQVAYTAVEGAQGVCVCVIPIHENQRNAVPSAFCISVCDARAQKLEIIDRAWLTCYFSASAVGTCGSQGDGTFKLREGKFHPQWEIPVRKTGELQTGIARLSVF